MKYKKVLVLNDTSYEGHVGCVLVMGKIKRICDKISLETEFLNIKRIQQFEKSVLEGGADLLIINGEGSFHHDSKSGEIIFEFVRRYKSLNNGAKVVLLNSAWFSNEKSNSYLELVDLACFRDKASMLNASPYLKMQPLVCPDFAFFGALDLIAESVQKKGKTNVDFKQLGISGGKTEFSGVKGSWLSIFIGRDSISTFKTQLNKADLYSPSRLFNKLTEHFLHRRLGTAEEYVFNMLDTKRLHTGRFHGVVVAIACNVSCSWVESNTPKIEESVYMFGELAGLKDVGHKEYQWSSLDERAYLEFVARSKKDLDALINEI